jgi:alpha-ribazole phosphatase
MEFALIRHTRCDVAAGTCYGHLDVPLASTAAADIELTLSRVPPVDLVFSSPSRRCYSLAQTLATRDGCEIRMREDLRELNFGSWEGVRWDDIPRTLSDAWAADPWNRAPPSGESESQLWQRATRMADELLQLETLTRTASARSDAVPLTGPPQIARAPLTIGPRRIAVELQRIAVVSHGGPLRHLRCLLTGTPASERWRWSIACGEVALIAPRGSACRSSGP